MLDPVDFESNKNPALNFYLPQGREEEIFLAAHQASLPLMLKGPTGCGKTRFVEAMAERIDADLITVACNEDTCAADLLGRFLIEGMETVWRDGPVTRAVRNGSILYLDEIAEARSDVITALHGLADHRRQLFLDRTNECLTAPPKFMLVVSFNPGYQHGHKELKPSLRQRFVSIDFSYPNRVQRNRNRRPRVRSRCRGCQKPSESSHQNSSAGRSRVERANLHPSSRQRWKNDQTGHPRPTRVRDRNDHSVGR